MMPDIVIIEDESVLREVLVEGLSGALPDLSFSEYGSVEEAVAGIEEEPPRLIISDVRLPGKSGLDFLIDAQQRWPSTQFILMTAFATLVSQEQAAEYGALRLLRKPFALKELTQAVVMALREETFAGKFRGISLMDLMQVINLGQKTLAIGVQHGKTHAEIFFRSGEIVHVDAAGKDGIEAFNELVSWQGGMIDVRYGKEPTTVSIQQPFQHLMLEAMRVLDHAARDQQQETAAAQRARRRARDGEQSFADVGDLVAGRESRQSASTLLQNIPEIDFTSLRILDGFIAAALVDSESGLIFSSAVVGGLDLQLTSTSHAELLRRRREMLAAIDGDDHIEDIVISLKRRYHVLRPLDESPLFLYAVFDRARSILAMVRQGLRNLEGQLRVEGSQPG